MSPFEMNLRRSGWRMTPQSELERERVAILNAPLPPNPPHLFTPVRARVLRPFYVDGRPAAIGDVVTLKAHDANSLAAIGKVDLL